MTLGFDTRTSTPAQSGKLGKAHSALNAVILLCCGGVPTFHLAALQMASILMLVSVVLHGRRAFLDLPRPQIAHFMLLQYVAVFAFNAFWFPSLEGNMLHFKRIALESWAMTLIGMLVMWVYLAKTPNLKHYLIQWMPLGLILSFLFMSYFFMISEGGRVKAYSNNALVPPIWFLVLTLISFCWFFEMSRPHQVLRVGLILMAGLMCAYSGGRMILAIWAVCAIALWIGLVVFRPGNNRKARTAIYMIPLVAVVALGMYAIDTATGGTIAMRVSYTVTNLRDVGLSQSAFFRLEIWEAALIIIADHWPWGAGMVNERFLIHEIIDRDWWFKSHQVYLSYMIGGGLIGLVSGVIFQLACLSLVLKKQTRQVFWPAVLGLLFVPSMNGLTESVFQSFFNIQFYILLCLMVLSLARVQQRAP